MILGNLFEWRSVENPNTPLWKAMLADDRVLAVGLSLSDEQAACVPDVFACHQVLAQDVAKAPLKLRRLRDDDRHEDATEHVLWELLRDLPNPETTAYQFRYELQRDLLAYSRAYAEIIRKPSGEVAQLWRLDPRHMVVTRDGLNRKQYEYRIPNGSPIYWTFHPDRPPILELTHESPIRRCRELIGLAYALELFAAKFFANGARVSGLLEVPPGFSELAKKNLRESFADLFGGAKNAHKVPVLEAGATFKPISAPNNEAQFNETRKLVRTMIAGVHRVPPHKIGDLERSTFSNIEHQSIEYVGDALDPFFVAWEQAIRRDLLTTRQYPRYEVLFDRDALIRADIGARANALRLLRQDGLYSANDIRKKLGENPIAAEEGGDLYLINGNMVPMVKAGESSQVPASANTEGDTV